jgi:eukaryotic-like serine/threonine-protein kinase
VSRKVDPSAAPKKDREAPTEMGSLGTGTLAFEPRFSLETHYAGEAPEFAEGSQFGVYVVGPCIGEGGMARVYRAEHAGLKRQVALKVMTQGFARDKEGRERFLREARIAAAIKHPNVVNIFDVGVCQGIPYLVMELLEGEDLEKVLLSRGALDEGTIIDLVVPVVAGLVAVHDAGIVHRDLKPGNIFLARGRNDEFEPKLLDFGISKASGQDHLRLTAANGSLMGTPFYMAPEAVQGAEMTPLSDQYALGVVLRECATGKNPFEGNNFAEVVRLITNAKYSAMTESHPRLSKRFVAIVERAMSVDPNNRFGDMRAMGRQLLLLAGQRTRITWGLTFGQDNRAPATALERKAPEAEPDAARSARPRQKRGMTVLLGGIALLSAAATFLFLLSNRATSPSEDALNAGQGSPHEVTVIMPNKAQPDEAPAPAPQLGPESGIGSVAAPNAGAQGEASRFAPAAAAAAAPPATAIEATPRRTAQRPPAQVAERGERKARPAPPAAPRRRVRPAAPASERPEEREADWAVTPNPKSSAQRRPDVEVGSNSAPILD